MTETYVIDACGLLAFLKDEEGAEKVETILENALNGACDVYMNGINLLEIFYGIYREDGREKAEATLQKIKELPIEIVSRLDDRVFHEAGRLKATYRISLADSIVLAEGSTRKALVVTSDHHEFDIIEEKDASRFFWVR